jgi:hypothetical protein
MSKIALASVLLAVLASILAGCVTASDPYSQSSARAARYRQAASSSAVATIKPRDAVSSQVVLGAAY